MTLACLIFVSVSKRELWGMWGIQRGYGFPTCEDALEYTPKKKSELDKDNMRRYETS